MNVTLLRLRPLLRLLKEISLDLRRLADLKELELANNHGLHLKPPKADTRGPDPEIFYTDEEAVLIEEIREHARRSQSLTGALKGRESPSRIPPEEREEDADFKDRL